MHADEKTLVDGPLAVASHRYGREVVVVSLAGELDQANVATARRTIDEALDGSGEEIVVIDLSRLEFIDSSGIALLVALSVSLDVDSLRIVPSEAPGVSRVLTLTGVDSLAPLVQDHPAAPACG